MVSTTEVCSSMETSEVYTVKAPNSGDANSVYPRIADTFSWKAGISAKPYMKISE